MTSTSCLCSFWMHTYLMYLSNLIFHNPLTQYGFQINIVSQECGLIDVLIILKWTSFIWKQKAMPFLQCKVTIYSIGKIWWLVAYYCLMSKYVPEVKVEVDCRTLPKIRVFCDQFASRSVRNKLDLFDFEYTPLYLYSVITNSKFQFCMLLTGE